MNQTSTLQELRRANEENTERNVEEIWFYGKMSSTFPVLSRKLVCTLEPFDSQIAHGVALRL